MSESIFPAATVIILRDGRDGLEVLLLRRAKSVAFAGGSWVFPGGRIDPDDYAGGEDIELAARNAAVRETMEEAGLPIADHDLEYYSHWTAPKETPKRFATWFFMAGIETDLDVIVDGGEIDYHQWYTPSEALAAVDRQEIHLLPPTFVTLFELANHQTVSQAMTYSRARPTPTYLPKMTYVEGGVCMLYPGDAGYETEQNNIDGDRHRFWMMSDGWRYEKSQNGV